MAGDEADSMKNIIRVFPRRTKATPNDEMVYTTGPHFWSKADEVHVSVAFTYDLPRAEWLTKQWAKVAPVTIGGPALGMRGEEFVPGKYLKHGYVITSRGCPRRCWFCSVWKRDGTVRELPIHDGWNILDDNLLACSESHVRSVFAMLTRQKRRVEFTGGLEALSLQDYQVGLLADLKPRPVCFFAYDPGDDFATVQDVGRRLLATGFTRASHNLRCYVLVGYPKDTMASAEKRLLDVLTAGFTPFAMLWQPDTKAAEKFRPGLEWKAFQRSWARPAVIHARLKT